MSSSSVITSKAANGHRLKSGQRGVGLGLGCSTLPRAVLASPRTVSEAPLYREAVAWQYSEGRFGYSDLKGAARQVGIYVL